MRVSIKSSLALIAASAACGAMAGPLVLTGANYVTYGNGNVYSMPINAAIYDAVNGGGTGPGNPYYVNSTPGNIKDQLVIYTGASGTDVQTNAAGFDNAYLAPNGKEPSFASIAGAVNVVDPGNKAGIANNDANTWDANLLSLKGFLGSSQAVFMFNNNDTNKDQSLGIWAKLWITDSSNSLYGNYLYVSNEGKVYGTPPAPGNPSLYNPGDVTPSIDPVTGKTDYIMAGGQTCLDASFVPKVCAPGDTKYNHNLGANQVAYATNLPTLDAYFQTLFGLGDAALNGYTFHLDVRMGCDSGWNDDCAMKSIDNGYEQLFLVAADRPPEQIPEPSVLALSALALLGLAGTRRRKH